MQDQNLFLRNDTFFGVCEAIGTDFGFHANWLRVALAFALFFDPVLTISAYLVMGIFVVLARLIYPARAATTADLTQSPQKPIATGSNDEQPMLPLAA